MKPAPFDYYSPDTVEGALAHLAEHGYDAKVLAGGQSLVPMMNFRLVQPAVLVDLNRISELSFIRPDGNGGLLLGAMTRHNQVERNTIVAERLPLLYEAMPHIATSQIRSRGTFGGSIAHADPSAELSAVAVALDGRFKLRSQRGERWVSASDFFIGMFTTLLEPDEILVETAFPNILPHTGWALFEVARRPHDFALVGVAATLTLDKKDRCQRARLVFLSVGEGPVEAQQAAEILKGQVPTPEVIRAAAEAAATVDTDPSSDIHATAEFRRHLVNVLAKRALQKAYQRARGGG
jgi:carbon-monoxide dehydrogenase medium subunit